jgi:adenylate cyclase
MKRHLVQICLSLLLVLVFLGSAVRLVESRFMDQLDLWSYDARLRVTMPGGLDPRIVIVDLDEKSLAEVGRWPWGRDKLATLLDRLFQQYGAAVVGFDVIFGEPDTSSGLSVLENLARKELRNTPPFLAELDKLRGQLDFDQRFAEKLKQYPVVLSFHFTAHNEADGREHAYGQLPSPTFPSGTFGQREISDFQPTGYWSNLKAFQESTSYAGHINPHTDLDGVMRLVPMLIDYHGNYYESLSIAMVRRYFKIPGVSAVLTDDGGDQYGGLEWLKLGDLSVPVGKSIRTLVPYRGAQGSFPYVSASDVLHGRLKPGALSGAIVLIGTTAPGLMDLRSTPVQSVYPGVEIHANLIAGILDQNLKQRPAYFMAVEVFSLILLGGLLTFILPLLSPLKSSLISLLAFVSTLGVNFWVWQNGMVLPIVLPLLLILSLYTLDMVYGYFTEVRKKKMLTNLFGQYIPPELVNEMSLDPEHLSMKGENRDMTVLFSDIRNFTSISETLDPKQLTDLINRYLTPMTQIIHKHRGTIDKYIGDAIMAFWGAPLKDPEHARHALLAGLEMQQHLATLMTEFEARKWPVFRIGIGINSGVVTVGNMGSEFRRAYTVMGDHVNLASRLESLTKQYGVGIIVGEATKLAVPEVVYRELDRVRVKGKLEPVSIYQPLGLQGQVAADTLDELTRYQEALQHYHAQDWDAAEQALKQLETQQPETRLYTLYLERIVAFREHPPAENWDGVTVFTVK